MLVLSFTVASPYYSCCTDSSTSPENDGSPDMALDDRMNDELERSYREIVMA
jgi:hypothetical protein